MTTQYVDPKTGALNAVSGFIGGWSIGATRLSSGSGVTAVGLDSGGTNPAFYVGSDDPLTALISISPSFGIKILSATDDAFFKLHNTAITGEDPPVGFINMNKADPLATDRGTVNFGHFTDASTYSALLCYTDTVSLVVSRAAGWKNLLQANFDFCRIEVPIRLPNIATPTAADMHGQIYINSAGKLVVQWLSGGVTRYKYIDLTNSDTTWSYATSAP